MGTGPYAPLDRQQLVCVPGHSSARCCSRVGAVRGVDRSEAMALVCMAAHGRRVLRRRADVAVLASDSPLCAVCKSARRGILRRRVVALYPASTRAPSRTGAQVAEDLDPLPSEGDQVNCVVRLVPELSTR